MTGNKVTGLLAAAAVALGVITMGCVEDEADDRDLPLYAPTEMTKADLIDAVAKSTSLPMIEIGYIDGDTGAYHFDDGLILDPGEVAEIDETGLAVPDACDEDECTEDGDGHYPLRGEVVSSRDASWMYIDDHGDGYVICWGWCDETVCGETCVYDLP